MRLYFFERLVEEAISDHETWPRHRPGLVIGCGYDGEFDDYSLRIFWGLVPGRTATGLIHKHYIRIGFHYLRRRPRFGWPIKFDARWR